MSDKLSLASEARRRKKKKAAELKKKKSMEAAINRESHKCLIIIKMCQTISCKWITLLLKSDKIKNKRWKNVYSFHLRRVHLLMPWIYKCYNESHSIWHMWLLFDCFLLSLSLCVSLSPFSLFIPPSGARRSKGLWISGKRSPLGQKTRQGEVMKDKQLAANTC